METTQPFLAYRDRIGVASEIGFLRRQYIGFTHLHPIWTGRTVLPDARQVGGHILRLGGNGALGPLHRLLFRYFGRVPPLPAPTASTSSHSQGLGLGVARARPATVNNMKVWLLRTSGIISPSAKIA